MSIRKSPALRRALRRGDHTRTRTLLVARVRGSRLDYISLLTEVAAIVRDSPLVAEDILSEGRRFSREMITDSGIVQVWTYLGWESAQIEELLDLERDESGCWRRPASGTLLGEFPHYGGEDRQRALAEARLLERRASERLWKIQEEADQAARQAAREMADFWA